MNEREYEYEDEYTVAASTEQLIHTIKKRKLLTGWRERKKWKDGFKYYVVSSEELTELERRAK